jgi:hypothetical protein
MPHDHPRHHQQERTEIMELKPGTRLRSTVCETQVVVVRAPSEAVELGCGGAPLDENLEGAPTGEPAPDLAGGTLLGKRYADAEVGLELLCSHAGVGTLTCNGVEIPLKDAKPLPSSD